VCLGDWRAECAEHRLHGRDPFLARGGDVERHVIFAELYGPVGEGASLALQPCEPADFLFDARSFEEAQSETVCGGLDIDTCALRELAPVVLAVREVGLLE
jgi:hypothetical protein